MRLVRVDLGTSRHRSVWVAETFWERLRGLMGRSSESALLLRGGSVHSVGLRRGLTVIALDAEFRVLAIRPLPPGSMCAVRGARWMLEVPASAELPPVGAALRFLAPE